jgi:hypothetical protein
MPLATEDKIVSRSYQLIEASPNFYVRARRFALGLLMYENRCVWCGVGRSRVNKASTTTTRLRTFVLVLGLARALVLGCYSGSRNVVLGEMPGVPEQTRQTEELQRGREHLCLFQKLLRTC